MQVGVRLAVMGVFNNVALFVADAVVEQDNLILFDEHYKPGQTALNC